MKRYVRCYLGLLVIFQLHACEAPLGPLEEKCEPGSECPEEKDDCAEQPCQNGSNCVDGIASFTCECPNGYEGDTCEINTDDCAERPCQNGANCVEASPASPVNVPMAMRAKPVRSTLISDIMLNMKKINLKM